MSEIIFNIAIYGTICINLWFIGYCYIKLKQQEKEFKKKGRYRMKNMQQTDYGWKDEKGIERATDSSDELDDDE